MKALPLFRKFRIDDRGAVAMLFGLSAIVLFSIVGVAINSSRAYNVRSKMTSALDAAALAAAKLFDQEAATDAEFQSRAEAYVSSYMKRVHVDNVSWSNVQTNVDRTTGSVTVSADVSMVSLFGGISAGITDFNFTPTARVVYKPRKIELALVLDVTGSMCDIVPATASEACYSGAKIGALKDAARAMVDALAATAPPRGAVRVSVVPYSASVNAGPYAGTVTGGASVDGCVVERAGGNAYTDASPFSGLLGTSSVADNPSYSCPPSVVLPLTDLYDVQGRDEVHDAIDNLAGFGGTAGHLGAAWGWYMVSPNWASVWPSDSAPRAYDKEKVIKIVVLMTDGMFNTAYRNGGESYVWPDTLTTDKTKPGTSGFQALKLCENMRALNGDVQLYTVGFQTPADAEALLRECSGDANFTAADSAQSLIESFKTIASKISAMRVSG